MVGVGLERCILGKGEGCSLKANLGKRERESKKRNEGWNGMEGWAEDGKEGRASCSSVTCILVPGEAERRSAQTFAGVFFSPRKAEEEERWRGRRGRKGRERREKDSGKTWFLMVWVCRRAKRSKF